MLSARRTTSPAVAAPPRVTDPISGGGEPTSPRARATRARGRAGCAPAAWNRVAIMSSSAPLSVNTSISRNRWVIRGPEYTETVSSTSRAITVPSSSSNTVSTVTVTRRATSSIGACRAYMRISAAPAAEGAPPCRRSAARRRPEPPSLRWSPGDAAPSLAPPSARGKRPIAPGAGRRCPNARSGASEPARRSPLPKR